MTDTTPTSTTRRRRPGAARARAREARSGVRVFGAARRRSSDEQSDAARRRLADGEQWDREERAALRRVPGLSTELEDVTEVEYRQLRLENVVLVGVLPAGRAGGRRELAARARRPRRDRRRRRARRRAAAPAAPRPGTYLGSGKAQELRDVVAALGADTVIADTELAPSQRRALEDVVKVKVIDRTAVILDIFSQHAKSREGKAQVELAQLEYLLPRLRGWGESMSRQAGGQVGAGGAGMGSRGPGETKIELDRRRIRTRMALLRRQIRDFAPAREAKRAEPQAQRDAVRRDRRLHERRQVEPAQPLTSAGVLVENALFATLDATVRRSTRRPTAACTRSPTPSASCATCRTSSSRRSARRSRRSATPTSSCTSSTPRTPTRPRSCRPCAT